MFRAFRLKVVLTYIVTMLAFLGILLRLAYIVQPDNIHLPEWHARFRPVLRGSILDRNGSYLALTVSSSSIFLRPAEFTNKNNVIQKLAKTTRLSAGEIVSKIEGGHPNFVWLMRQVPSDVGQAVNKLQLPGVAVTREPRRLYPYNDLAAQLIGFSGVDHVGLTGIEKGWDKTLLGKQSSGGDVHNIILSLDRFIQYIVEDELKQALQDTGATRAQCIVYQPQTGDILAMASRPSFNLNRFTEYQSSDFVNPNIMLAYEPGSTFKIFTAAYLLKEQAVSYKDTFHCPGDITLYDHTVRCTHAHGTLNLPGIIKHSCNVGTIKLSRKIKSRAFYEFLKELGFGSRTGLTLPGESAGVLHPEEKWSGISKAMLSIGYEISVTPLQLIRAAGIIASQGELMKPRIVKAITDWQGRLQKSFPPRKVRDVCPAAVTRDVARMLREAVRPDGTGSRAALPNLEVGGKTGTANIPWENNAGYDPDRYNASFIGFLPYLKSRLVILVILREPEGLHYGGEVAAPVFARISSRILQYLSEKADIGIK